jgi:hypothetical protein
VGLGIVVMAALRAEVGLRRVTAFSVGNAVVEVAFLGGVATTGKYAVLIPGSDVIG